MHEKLCWHCSETHLQYNTGHLDHGKFNQKLWYGQKYTRIAEHKQNFNSFHWNEQLLLSAQLISVTMFVLNVFNFSDSQPLHAVSAVFMHWSKAVNLSAICLD